MPTKDNSVYLHSVLIVGATGMLGGRIAHQLIELPGVSLRILAREEALSNSTKKERLLALEAHGASIVFGDLAASDSLQRATEGVDVVVSAVQGGPHVIVDGQLALARAAHQQGVWRMIPSDFALDLFAATPGEHPAFDWRREADRAIAELGMEHIHVLTGAFLDGMVDMAFDHAARTVNFWGSGDEVFEATTVEDTARFTARAAIDHDLISGPMPFVGDRVSANSMTEVVERVSGQHYTRHSNGSVDDLRATLTGARDRGDVMSQTYAAYLLYMANGQTRVADPQNSRYPEIEAETFADVARRALGGM
jgi:uncharacterized protein YbjT (DUF2867 family)